MKVILLIIFYEMMIDNLKNLNYLPEKLKLMSNYTLDDLHEARAAQKSRNTQRI